MTTDELLGGIKWDERGLVPAVVQDANTKEVLMMAYMNEESLRLTLEKGETVFWSRSRSELWHKGATSGNTQKVVSLRVDCDGDTLLIDVVPAGPACHTGEQSCFYSGVTVGDGADAAENRFDIIEKLERTIAQRERERPEGAYTTYLFDKGIDKILKKVGEEAAEVIIAAKNRSPEELRYEASDLIFHMLVLLQEQKLPLDEVLKELAQRHKPD
ncbi:bifunctional phosphoribosyl-AMP cyclohydrolase/phosphoribosyl-ATP diphosphatase HisIE [Paenibacillus thermotolerans]|uniref:bifunctional phosphoribosyl-AMP cyclohydrolase/phosphoribosyl-ATP diphosphatase HisIE n=1 Tax=Paenibacillus thermotolerans TaxID=3027807 RepID=UPI00236808D3|nr:MULTISPECIES: bifunctional phosphoribosyl-AMP cyclohydrolase/phosphoribosyl-ATP diphosphatase HisIE [unclassified Paenibacillus]